MKPTPAKPKIIMAQVEVSGTALTDTFSLVIDQLAMAELPVPRSINVDPGLVPVSKLPFNTKLA